MANASPFEGDIRKGLRVRIPWGHLISNFLEMKTRKEIDDKIEEIVSDSDNFVVDNFGSEAADNGIYEENYSEMSAINTLTKFAEWLNE